MKNLHLIVIIAVTFSLFLFSSAIATHLAGSCLVNGEKYCGDQSPDGCYCDVDSYTHNDHCQDIATECPEVHEQGQTGTAAPTPTPTPSTSYEGSCQKCDGKGTSYGSQECWCDNLCEGYGDCCTGDQGYQSLCGGAATATGTCQGYCDTQSPAGCWCDTACVGAGDCCSDYESVCQGTGTAVTQQTGGGAASTGSGAQNTLQVKSTGVSGVSITGSQAGTSGITDASGTYTITKVENIRTTLTAPTTASGKNFLSWNGCNTATSNTCIVTVSNGGTKTVTAAYQTATPASTTLTLTATAASCPTNSVSLSWNQVSSGAVQYNVFRALSGGAWNLIATPTSASYTDTSVTRPNNYYYRIAAQISPTNIIISNEVLVNLASCPTTTTCSGTGTFGLDPSTVSSGGSTKPILQGLSNCNGQAIQIKKGDSCTTGQLITTCNYGQTCSSFTAPANTGQQSQKHKYYACRDGQTIDWDELTVNPSSVTLTAPLKVKSPNGGETFQRGGTLNIQYESLNIQYVNIVLRCGSNSFNVGSEIGPLTSGTHWPWIIPTAWFGVPSTQCKVEISNSNNPSVSDLSDNFFSIT